LTKAMENTTQVKFFYLFGLQETFNNKSVYFILSLITYLLIITVNLTMIITIIQEKGLHEPMYIFLCSLCVNGLYGTAGFYPKLLLDLQSDVQVISYGGCFIQTYVIYTSVMCEMSTLTVMSYDRYVAICRPLLYHTIVTSLTVRKLLLFSWCYSLFTGLIALSLAVRIPLCGSRIDKIFLYCDNYSVVKLACSNTMLNNISGLVGTLVSLSCTIFPTIYSYVRILQICLKSSKEKKQKAFNTCTPHIASLLNFSFGCLFVILQGRYDTAHLPPILRTFLLVYFLICPPLFNPIMYGVRMVKIRQACKKVLGLKT
uniref:Olfactory receptor n=1 Tax=Salmo trutta TaxID=8032 RepID=A0A673XEU5_SALTR